MSQAIEDIDPQTALEDYLADKELDGCSDTTLYSHRSRLGHFVEWCGLNDVDSLSELRPTDMRRYKQWRSEDELAKVTLKTQLDTLRVFVRWAERFGYCRSSMSEAVVSPTLEKGDNVRNEVISPSRCEKIRDYLRKYHYAERAHVVFELIWHCTLRKGAVYALDVEDFRPEKKQLRIHHRPDTGTPLKNKEESNRIVNLSDDVTDILSDWVDDKRADSTDEYGRRPLISTEFGRAHKTTLSSDIYYVTWPGYRDEECGCKDGCKVTCANNAHYCVDSISSHTLRKAAITHHLDNGWLIDMVADRADNSANVIRKHYDKASDEEKAERRKKFMDLLEEDNEDEEDGPGGVAATVQ